MIAVPTITPTAYEKTRWSNMAFAAYKIGRADIGHLYSVAATIPDDMRVTVEYFDRLQRGYRHWLVWNEFPADIVPARA